MKSHQILAIVSVAAVGLGCRWAPAAEAKPGAAAPPPATRAAQPHATEARSAQAAFDAMDTRTSVPLLPMMAAHQKQNMRDHLLAIQEIIQGLAGNDLPAVEKAAGRIGYSAEEAMMCTHMGAGAPGFTEQALKFHHTADGIAAAAHKRDRKGALDALAATLQTCTACHAVFKQTVVDEPTWTKLTAQPPPTGHIR